MHKRCLKISVIVALILNLPMGNQVSASLMQNVKFRSITIEDGLSQNTVNSILQDKQGFLWFGTLDGLNKYDGYSIKTYRKDLENLNSLSDNYILTLYEDPKGNIWIGTYGGGLNKFDPATERFTRYTHDPDDPNSIGSNSVWGITSDDQGTLWIGCWRGGLNKFDPKQEIFEIINLDTLGMEEPTSYTTWPVFIDSEGLLWAGLFRQGLLRFDLHTGKKIVYKNNSEKPESIIDNHVRCIFEDRDKNLWLGTSQGLEKFNKNSARFSHFTHDALEENSISNNDIRSIFQDSQNRLWVGTVNGLNLYSGKEKTFVQFFNDSNDPLSISNDRIAYITEDQGGILWIGTVNGGVNKFDPRMSLFRYFGHHPGIKNSLSNNFVKALYEDEQGALWVGTNTGLNKLQSVTSLNPFLPLSYKSSKIDLSHKNGVTEEDLRIIVINQDHTGELWIGTWGEGIYLADKNFKRIKKYVHNPEDLSALSSNYIRDILPGQDKNMWIGTLDGLNRYSFTDKKFKQYKNIPEDSSSISNDRITQIFQDSENILWIGTENGLNKYDRQSDLFTCYLHNAEDKKSLSNNRIRVIIEDSHHTLWIGTDEGLNRFNPQTETFDRYTTNAGLPNNVIYGILEDETGNLWISTNWGLSKYNTELGSFTNFTVDDGLQANEFNARAFFKNKSGLLYFGGINGFNYFDPKTITSKEYNPPVVITDFYLYNDPVSIGYDKQIDRLLLNKNITETTDLRLNENDKIFSFEFSALDYANPAAIRYQYLMEGLNDQWINTDARKRFVTFTTLNPGDYTFRVRAALGNANWSKNQAEINISIPPPFWLTWWFRIIALLFISSIVLSIFYTRIRIIRKRQIKLEQEVSQRTHELDVKTRELETANEELKAFSYSVSHDLRGPVRAIDGYSKIIIEEYRTRLDNNVIEYLERIYKNSTIMDLMIDSYLKLSRITQGELTKEKLNMSSMVQDILDELMLNYSGHHIETIIQPELYAQGDKLLIKNMLQNLFDNALKYSKHKKTIRIEFGRFDEKDNLPNVFFIKDNGVGFNNAYRNQLFVPFQRLHADQNIEGIGIGLASVSRIINRHGGKIWADGRPDQGATMYFTL